MEQNYANHKFSPKLANAASLFWAVAFVSSARYWWMAGHQVQLGIAIFCILACVFLCVAMCRVYITALQDRIIKLELKLRTSSFLTPQQQGTLFRLKKSQWVSLRFASDQEFPALLERAKAESLTGEQIKQAIKVWVPDWDRT